MGLRCAQVTHERQAVGGVMANNRDRVIAKQVADVLSGNPEMTLTEGMFLSIEGGVVSCCPLGAVAYVAGCRDSEQALEHLNEIYGVLYVDGFTKGFDRTVNSAASWMIRRSRRWSEWSPVKIAWRLNF